LGTLQFGFGSLASFVVSVTTTTSSMPMTIAMCVCASCALISLLVGRSFIKFSHSSSTATTSSLH
jgi:membrane protein implicated in regulation of membrane protease activity